MDSGSSMIEGWIGVYSYDGEIRIQPTLYKTKEEAISGLAGMTMKYSNSHFRFICEPIFIKQERLECV